MNVTFTKEKITDHLYRIKGIGDVAMYFVFGKDRGMLIDTGYGVGDLKGYIEDTFHMPYEVLITHGHVDHASGCQQWDTVYMNPLDKELFFERTQYTFRKLSLSKNYPDIQDSDFIPVYTGTFKDLEDGMTFDLGDITLETYSAPGHTHGMMVVLIPEERICLFGDACGVMTFIFRPECSTVEQYLNTLSRLKSMEDRYDRILRQHGTCESPKSLVDENIEVAKEILAGTDDHIPWKFQQYDVFIAKETDFTTGIRKDGKSGNIVYSLDHIK